MRRLLRVTVGLSVLAGAAFVGIMVWARSAPRPTTLDLTNGHLVSCPPTPNCVASEQASPAQLLPALSYSTSLEDARAHLLAVVRARPGARINVAEPHYVAAEFRIPVLGFVDDVEFRFDDAAKQIHFRSASRLGRNDLGVNRRRIQAISRAFHQATSAP